MGKRGPYHKHDQAGGSSIVETPDGNRILIEEHVRCTCGVVVNCVPKGSRPK